MNVQTLSDFLFWCAVINYAVLLIWFAAFLLAHDSMRRLHGRWFRLSDEQFDQIHYALMGFYKLSIFFFNLVPFIALRLIG